MEDNEVMQLDTTSDTSEESENDGFLEAFDETPEEEPEEEVNEDTSEEVEAAPEAEQKYQIRVDHKDIELTLDELKANAQKGMAYDRLKGNYESARAITDRLAEVAKKQNVSIEQLITQAEEGYRSVQFEELKGKYVDEGYDEDIAETLANKDLEIANAKKEVPAAPTEEEIKRQRDIDLFNQLYPDLTVSDIPEEVFADMQQKGMTLIEAYQRHENAELRKQTEAVIQNAKNAKTSLGSAKDNKQTLKNDMFLSEFLKE